MAWPSRADHSTHGRGWAIYIFANLSSFFAEKGWVVCGGKRPVQRNAFCLSCTACASLKTTASHHVYASLMQSLEAQSTNYFALCDSHHGISRHLLCHWTFFDILFIILSDIFSGSLFRICSDCLFGIRSAYIPTVYIWQKYFDSLSSMLSDFNLAF